MEQKKEPTYFLFTKEEQKAGRIHYNRMLYQYYYEYIRDDGEYDNYHHYMECFYKSRNITYDTSDTNDISDTNDTSDTNDNSMDDTSYESPLSKHSLITCEYTPSENKIITPLSKNSISSISEEISLYSIRDSDLSISMNMIDVSDDMIDVSSIVKQNNTTDVLTPHSPVRKRSKHCFCFYKEFEDDSYD